MTTNITNIALTGLRAAQAGLGVTANNIANQGTPGYSRQHVVLQSARSNFSGAGYFGQGVDVATVQRAYSEFLTGQASQSASALSYLGTYSDQMGSLVNRLGSVDTGVPQSLNALYAAFGGFSQRPGETASRQAALAAAQAAAARFRAVSDDLSALSQGIGSQARAAVGQINQLAQGIADYNAKIGDAYASGNGQAPNGLLDQRDVLVRELGKLTGIATSSQGTSLNIYLANGQPLVMEHLASQLQIDTQDPRAPHGTSLALVMGGHTTSLNRNDVDGGQLGALLQFRDHELAQTQAELGRLAIAMAAAYNQQQQFGLDGAGQPGQALFRLGNPAAVGERNNTGDARLTVGIADTRSLTGSDYALARVGSEYVVTRLDDGTEFGPFSSLPQRVEGLDIGLAGGDLADGDAFTIQVASQAAAGLEVLLGDAGKLAAAAPMSLQTAEANTGTAQPSRLRSVEAGESRYGSSITVRFTSAAGYELLGEDGGIVSTGTLQPPQQTISYNGWAFDLAGTPAAGDRITVKADPGAPAGDNRNALAMAALGTDKIAGGVTLTDAYAALVSQVGTRTASLNVSRAAQQTAYDQAVAWEQSLSGVNLDEEGANLLRYQQAYAAAGKVLGMSSDLFDQLLAAIH